MYETFLFSFQRTLSRYFNVSYPTASISPSLLSKVNTSLQLGLAGITLVSTILPYDLNTFLYGLCWCTAATTFGSGVSYIFDKKSIKFLRNHNQIPNSTSQKEGGAEKVPKKNDHENNNSDDFPSSRNGNQPK